MDRRLFLQTAGSAGGLLLTGSQAQGAKPAIDGPEFRSALTDISLCNGCRRCEQACAEANGNPAVADVKDTSVFELKRTTGTDQFTVVNRYQTEKGPLFVKQQCMHCNQPGCAAACLVKAMHKRPEGPVLWHGDRCMGCRYCMVSCPFDVPKFEYDSWNPRLQKCFMCWDRQQKGELPACVKVCPVEALLFGSRRELLEIAKTRIYTNPGKYVNHVYGEHEAGGLGWLFISPIPFERLGFKTNLGNTPVPEHTKGFLYGVPIVLLLWPAFLFGVSQIRRREQAIDEGGA